MKTEQYRDHRAEDARISRNRARSAEFDEVFRATNMTRREKDRRIREITARREPETEQIISIREVPAMTVPGFEFLTASTRATADALIEIADALRKLFAELDVANSADYTSRQIEKIVTDVSEAPKRAMLRIQEIENISRFFDPQRLSDLCPWASANYEAAGTYSPHGRVITFVPRDGGSDNVVIGLPEDFALPSLASLVRLQNQLGGQIVASAA